MNDRPVILKDMSKISEIKVTYFIISEEEYMEEDSLFFQYKKEILLNDYYDQVKDLTDDKEVDAFIVKHYSQIDNLHWIDFIRYVDMFYDYPPFDNEIIYRMKKHFLIHYDNCYMIVQYYDKLFYEMMMKRIPVELKVLHQGFVIIEGKALGYSRLPEVIENLKKILNYSESELGEYLEGDELKAHYEM